MHIVLYYAPITCALAPYITLTEANARFDVRTLNLRKDQQHSPEYLKLNPKHKVPLLIVDGRTLTESAAIQTWIARTFPPGEASAGRPLAGVESAVADVLVLVGHSPVPRAHQFAAQGLRRA